MRVRGVPRRRATRAAAAALLTVGLALPAAARAGELRVVEAVGTVPVVPGGAGGPPRDRAIDAALREAVTRVAEELLIDAEPAADEEGAEASDPHDRLDDALEGDIVPFTNRYRIIEDRGPRPALFGGDRKAGTEYVVVVEVTVDVDRVRTRMVDAGLLRHEENGEQVVVLLDLEGLDAWPAYAALRDTLLHRAGATSVVPRGFERGRARIEVASQLSAGELVDRLLRSTPPGLAIQRLDAGVGSVKLHLTWTPPAAGPGDATAAGSSPGDHPAAHN